MNLNDIKGANIGQPLEPGYIMPVDVPLKQPSQPTFTPDTAPAEPAAPKEPVPA